MGRDGLLIGEVATQSGVSRKAVRLYEAAGILPPPRRTAAGYRVYGRGTQSFLAFITQARRFGFRLEEIKEIAGIKRSGRVPCPNVHDLVRRKFKDLDKALADLTEVRQRLRELLKLWRPGRRSGAVICPHIEHLAAQKRGETPMETSKVSLCPACSACPEAETLTDNVRIGEAGNLVVLRKDEWNVLVDLIQSGQLSKI